MAAPITSVVDVSITLATGAVEQTGFGTALIAGYHTVYNDVVRTYAGSTGLTDLVSDGFSTLHPIYRAASALLAQSPKVSEFKVGKLTESDLQAIRITPIAANSTEYSIQIGTETATYTSDGTATVAEICAGLTTAINAFTVTAATAVDSTTHVTVTVDAAETEYAYTSYDHALIQLTDVTGTNTALATDLAAIVEADDDWYALILANQPEADINTAAAWVQTQYKVFMCDSPDAAIISSSTTDVMSDIEAGAYSRTGIFFHKFVGEHIGAAFLGDVLRLTPGAYTGHMHSLSGVTVDDIKSASITHINNKTGNYYAEIGGSNRVFHARMGSGEFFDNIVFGDWMRARLQERVLNILFAYADAGKKLPYTRAGLAVVEAAIRAQIIEGARVGGLNLEVAPVINVPDLADISDNDKAARLLQGVTFSATLSGAIHKIIIDGVLTLS